MLGVILLAGILVIGVINVILFVQLRQRSERFRCVLDNLVNRDGYTGTDNR